MTLIADKYQPYFIVLLRSSLSCKVRLKKGAFLHIKSKYQIIYEKSQKNLESFFEDKFLRIEENGKKICKCCRYELSSFCNLLINTLKNKTQSIKVRKTEHKLKGNIKMCLSI